MWNRLWNVNVFLLQVRPELKVANALWIRSYAFNNDPFTPWFQAALEQSDEFPLLWGQAWHPPPTGSKQRAFPLTKRRPLTSARVVGHSLANVHVWTTFCPVVSAGKTSQRHSHTWLRLSPNCDVETQHCPGMLVSGLFHRSQYWQNEGIHSMPLSPLPLSSATLARLSQIRTQSSWGPGTRSVLSGCQAARLCLRSGSKSRHSSLKMSFGQRVPATPRKIGQLNFLPV